MEHERGQGLVEMAIITPLLILLLFGLFEVGFALRNYIVLANASREAARFAIRPGYLDMDAQDLRYDRVYRHTITAVGDQLPEFDKRGTVVLHLVEISAGAPCDGTSQETLDACDCAIAAMHPLTAPVVHTPADDSRYRLAYGPPVSSTVDYDALTRRMIPDGNRINCELMKRGGVTLPSSLVIVEIFYRHRQLFGVPFISNRLTDPIPMYAHTTMRLTPGVRGTGQEGDPFGADTR